MSQLSVDAGTLRGLAGQAQSLGSELGSLGQGQVDAGATAIGDAGLAAAIETFNDRWRERAAEMESEMVDAADFLNTFADTTEATDAAIAGRAN